MRVLLRAGLIMAMALSIAVPAQADHGGIHPTFRTEQNYFHCAGPVKVQNVSIAQGTIPSWDTDAPAGSVQDGEGCGFYDPLLSGGAGAFTASWQGTFTGNLDTLTVELHRLLPIAGASLPDRVVAVVRVDGLEHYNGDIDLAHQESDTGASTMAKFSLRNLNYANEDGDGTIERTVRIDIDSYNETQAAWVFDTTEVPAGITFNPDRLEGAIVQ